MIIQNFFCGTLVIGFLIDDVLAVFLISGLLYTIFSDVGFKRGDDYPAFLLARVCIAGVLSFVCKPWMGQNILGINALAEASGGTVIIDNITLIESPFLVVSQVSLSIPCSCPDCSM